MSRWAQIRDGAVLYEDAAALVLNKAAGLAVKINTVALRGVNEDELDDLIAWIKANPGKFAYNEPSTGGSGDAFVIAMIYKYSDYQKYVTQPFSAANEKDWDGAFAAIE